MKYDFQPFIGCEKIYFEESRETILERLGGTRKTFLRNEFARIPTDYFESLGFFVEYNEAFLCEMIEFTDEVQLFYLGEDLFKMGYSELRNKFDPLSRKLEVEDEIGVTYHDLGFAAMKRFGQEHIESISIFSENYG